MSVEGRSAGRGPDIRNFVSKAAVMLGNRRKAGRLFAQDLNRRWTAGPRSRSDARRTFGRDSLKLKRLASAASRAAAAATALEQTRLTQASGRPRY